MFPFVRLDRFCLDPPGPTSSISCSPVYVPMVAPAPPPINLSENQLESLESISCNVRVCDCVRLFVEFKRLDKD